MFYKRSDMIKYSFLLAGIAYLLNEPSYAQNKLDLLGDTADAAPIVSTNEQKTDELGIKAPELEQDELALTPKTIDKKDTKESPAPIDEKISMGKTLEEDPLMEPKDAFPLKDNSLTSPQQEKISSEKEPKEELVKDANSNMAQEADLLAPASATAPVAEDKSDKLIKETEADNSVLKAYNNFVEEQDKKSLNTTDNANNLSLSDKIMSQVKEDLFSQMSDIEKQTGLLTLELKREKIKNEIAAMKAQREKAIIEEQERQQEKERKQLEWEKEQERKTIVEQQKLKELEMQFEKLRQERVLKAYKESMLKSNQEWVDYNMRLYAQLIAEEKNQSDFMAKQKEYFKNLAAAITKASTSAQKVKEKYNKDIANLQTQIAILKSKLEAMQAEKAAANNPTGGQGAKAAAAVANQPNPFALASGTNSKEPMKKMTEEYAIMEISGKGDKLVAKLINKTGGTFMVKPGTILNTGHVIEEITQTYITADRGGVKDYLYFSAGGILDKEPSKPIGSTAKSAAPSAQSNKDEAPVVTSRIPSLREGMFVR